MEVGGRWREEKVREKVGGERERETERGWGVCGVSV